jgi:hypothetical protein
MMKVESSGNEVLRSGRFGPQNIGSWRELGLKKDRKLTLASGENDGT